MEIKSYLEEDYKGPCQLIISSVAGKSTKGIDRSLFNGFAAEENVSAIIKKEKGLKKLVQDTNAKIELAWNAPADELFVLTTLVVRKDITVPQIKEIANKVQDLWYESDLNGKVLMDINKKKGSIKKIKTKKESLNVNLIPVDLPKGYYWLGSIFDTAEKQAMYEEFLTDRTMYNRLRKMCVERGLGVTDEMTSSSALPIHKKDDRTNELVVSEKVLKVFTQFQLAQNYLSCEPDTAEFDMGKVLMLVPSFAEYMVFVSERAAEGKDPNMDNYQVELAKAIKYLEKTPHLMRLYENNLRYE